MGRSINILQSGDDIAKGLGQRTILTKVVMGIIVILLAGDQSQLLAPLALSA